MAKRRKHHRKTSRRRGVSGFGKDIDFMELGAGAAGALATTAIQAASSKVTDNADIQSASPLIAGLAGVYFFRKNKFIRTAALVTGSIGLANLLKSHVPGLTGLFGDTPLLGGGYNSPIMLQEAYGSGPLLGTQGQNSNSQRSAQAWP